jgi:lipoprotein-anchoring transpeptidase ErfK/SrfK
VDLSTQTVYAFENNSQVLKTTISSGIPRINVSKKGDDSDTPKGKFNTIIKHPSKHMGEGYFTDDVEAYILPGVPWVSFFTKNGVGFHGVYWHNNFGMTMSHGCVNMRTDEAKWIFRWTTPTVQPDTMETNGFGTFVEVF